ncbi:MAG: hypothetical protein MZV49_21645 [Rhodopseudomonas palustris]|nr:hypothetical protein [Rhodopseudomonas palustris]
MPDARLLPPELLRQYARHPAASTCSSGTAWVFKARVWRWPRRCRQATASTTVYELLRSDGRSPDEKNISTPRNTRSRCATGIRRPANLNDLSSAELNQPRRRHPRCCNPTDLRYVEINDEHVIGYRQAFARRRNDGRGG